MKQFAQTLSIIFITTLLFACKQKTTEKTTVVHDRMGKASREDKNGWIYVHLAGSPADIGYQHGYLLSKEIDTLIKVMQYYLPYTSKKDWAFYRKASARFMWGKIGKEYQDEIRGITEGLKAKGLKYDTLDITALNANIELAQYYVPGLMNKVKPGSGDNKAPGNCSAFIATGKYTKDGKIVIGHNNWTDYIVGERWNVIADIVPEKGNHILMDTAPGFIHSGDDFVETSSGIVITETTITGFKGFDTTRTPEFVRARKAAQYSNSIDDVIKIMTTDNNGGYANDWLIGDTKTNEVAKLELGLKTMKVWRSKDTAMIGSNFPADPNLIKQETTFDVNDKTNSPNARKLRMEKLVCVNYKGKLDADNGKTIEGDTFDALNNKTALNRCVIDGHIDKDPKGCPEWSEGPYYPMGAVQGKVATADMVSKLQLWAHMGHPSGDDFLAAPFLKQHPEYNYQAKYLRDMKAYPWTLFAAK
ncbi:C45 family autoproteolytic acyltransferase/hydrolase [Mucilaginibacter sp. KACC 22773]|uniref:C45 family autoproteolytic acyltransferase/hydolase n=1 Tax=Mucilaginibacter sp. KACC 22773 TaxID=3025671 RepID=UPI002366AAD2|nr:C45 family peptidase [Mucilaginibacter sp. KACC 22773]WDF79236.1 C45 family autoproteolytic acyltransferase/hydrolase [Mucilaginibacter sp. KACC 22773]